MPTELDRLEDEFHRVAGLADEERERALREIERDSGGELAAAVRELLAAAALTETALDGAALPVAGGITLVDDLRAFVLGGPRRPVPESAAEAESPETAAILPQMPGYRLLGRLGRGGSGTVYLAEQVRPEFTRTVALKIVDRIADPEASRRVEDEWRILARLEHPGIARLYDAGLTPAGQPYLAMERVDGLPISEHCERNALPVDARLRLFLAVLEAVDFAHGAGVVHRDLKPGNILVSARGEPKLLDFGIARVVAPPGEEEETRTLMRAMTPAYASPEQVVGQRVTAASDIYSLGVVLYELLAETLPYRVDGVRFETYEDAVRGQDPEPPSTAVTRSTQTTERVGSRAGSRAPSRPELARRRRALRGDLDAVVLRALRKEPAARYASVRALARDLECVLDGRPVEARAANRHYLWSKRLRRHWRKLAAGAALVAVLVALAQPGLRQRLLLPLFLPTVADGLSIFTRPAGANPEGARELAAGAAALRRSDGLKARARFTRAAEQLAGLPAEGLAWDGRARAEELLGEAAAGAAARHAAALAPRLPDLPELERERLRLRGLAAERAWDRAVPGLDRLFGRAPDRVDLGLDLWSALLASGQTEAAEATLRRIAQIPSQAGGVRRDPRLDLAEAQVAYRLGEHQRAAAAAMRAKQWAEGQGVPPIALRAARLHADALARLDLGDEARLELEVAAPKAAAAGLENEAALARLALGKIAARTADNALAAAILEEAHAALRRVGDRTGECAAVGALAFLASKSGDFAAGLADSRQAVELARELGDRWSEGEALAGYLALSNWAGDARAVAATREPAVRALRDSGNRQLLLETLNNLALDAIENLELDRAQSYLEEAAPLARRVGNRFADAGIERAYGFLEEARGALDAARHRYEAALAQARRAGTPLSVATYLEDLAWLEVAADRPAEAAALAREAIAAYEAVGKRSDAAALDGVLAWVAARRGDSREAHRRLAAVRLGVGDTATEPSFAALVVAARVAEAEGDFARALELRRQTVRQAEAAGLAGPLLEQRHALAQDLLLAGHRAEARRLATALLAEAERRGLHGVATALRKLLERAA